MYYVKVTPSGTGRVTSLSTVDLKIWNLVYPESLVHRPPVTSNSDCQWVDTEDPTRMDRGSGTPSVIDPQPWRGRDVKSTGDEFKIGDPGCQEFPGTDYETGSKGEGRKVRLYPE